ncbi:MAG: hypothetical protein ACK5H2_09170 [Beutenbergiaceae bacterium]
MTAPVRTLTAVSSGRLEFVESARPSLGPGEVAGTTLASILSPGTEISMAYPVEPRYPFPVPLGYSSVFRIDEVGAEVTDREVGQVVMSMGPHASWQVRSAAQTFPLPDGLDASLATFSRIMNIPLSIIATSSIRSGTGAGVIGLGLIGQLSARVLAACGFDVVAADESAERRDLLDQSVRGVAELAQGSVSLVIECSGHERNALAGVRALRPHGELALAGVPWRRRDDTYFFDVSDVVFHNFLTVRSGWEWQVPVRAEGMSDGHDMAAQFHTAMRMLNDGVVAVDGLSSPIRPDGIVPAYEQIRQRRAATLTFVVDWT